jgi:CDGSH-type Zn-finger protein
MARDVTHTESGPLRIDESDLDDEKGDIAICLCGLSGNYPFCDGAHRATEDEKEETTYKYANDDPDGERQEIREIVYDKDC